MSEKFYEHLIIHLAVIFFRLSISPRTLHSEKGAQAPAGTSTTQRAQRPLAPGTAGHLAKKVLSAS